MSDAKKIFISHSVQDKDLAEILCAAIEKEGYSCWIAPRDIPYGNDWAGDISAAIKASELFIFIMSKHSVESRQCPKEIAIADRVGKKMICVALDNAKMTDAIEYHFVSGQLCYGDRNAPEKTTEELLGFIRSFLPAADGTVTDPARKEPIGSEDETERNDPVDNEKKTEKKAPAADEKETEKDAPAEKETEPKKGPERPVKQKKKKEKARRQKTKKARSDGALKKEPDRKKKKRVVAVCVVAGLLVVGILGALPFLFGSKKSEAVITKEFLYGESVAARGIDDFCQAVKYADLAVSSAEGETSLNVSLIPFSVSGVPGTDGKDPYLRMGFADRFGELYTVSGSYSVSKRGILTVAADGNGADGDYALTRPQSFRVRLNVIRQLEIETVDKAGSYSNYINIATANGLLIVAGKLSSQKGYQDWEKMVVVGTTSTPEAASCAVGFTDGGRAVSPKIGSYTGDGSTYLNLDWSREEHPYNGRTETFDGYGSNVIKFVITYPYGFVVIDDGKTYYYQNTDEEIDRVNADTNAILAQLRENKK